MSKKLTAYLILICALGLTITAGYYSVVGLTIIFSGAFLPVLIFGSFLELSKVGITTYVHSFWKNIKWTIKTYLITAIIILSLITSLGIYGLLSSGFQSSILQTEINQEKIEMIDSTIVKNKSLIYNYQSEISALNTNEQNLRQALIDKTTLQSYNNKGQLITKANNGSRKSFDEQLKNISLAKDKIENDIHVLNKQNDSLQTVKFNISIEDKSSTELTSLKYFSSITGYDLKTIANIFIFILIFVFDPLAIILVLSANQAFKVISKKEKQSEVPETTNPEEKTTTLPFDTLMDIAELELENRKPEDLKTTSSEKVSINVEEIFRLLQGRSNPEKINIIDYVLNNYNLTDEDIKILNIEKHNLSKKLITG